MDRSVHCRLYQKELPGLSAPPFPGPVGEKIFQQVSINAWQEWLKVQTMLINEHQLKLANREARVFLSEQRDKFLNGETIVPEGYLPPSKQ